MAIDYAQIPALLAEGFNAEAIAERFGTTKASLAVQCSKRKISLQPPGPRRIRRKVRRGALDQPLELSEPTIELLKEKARQMHMHPAKLARDLIETIVMDDLYKAVLDVETT